MTKKKQKTLHLTPEICRLAYELLCETAPFREWNLPDSHDVIFKLTRSHDTKGHYKFWRHGRTPAARPHEIGISVNCVSTIASLMDVMAHEMVHLHEEITLSPSSHIHHSGAFRAWADEVCEIHRFDRKLFV